VTSLAGLLAANALLAVLGGGALAATGTWDRLQPASRIGPVLLVGFALAAALLPPLLYLGLSPTPLVVAALAALSAAAGLARRRRARGPAQRDASGHGFAAAAILGLLLTPLTLRAAFEPLTKFDAYANWTLKARLLYGHGGLISGGLDTRMLNGFYGASHREYPLGLPALEAFDFHVMGGADAQIIHLQFVIILAAFLATAWAFLRPRAGPALLTVALCLLVVAPGLHTQVLSAYADVPLACLWVAAVVALARWLWDGRDDLLIVSVLLAAGAAAVKQEGIVLDTALFAVAAVVLLTSGERSRLARLALAAAAVALSAVPWQVFVRQHDLHDADIAPSLHRSASQLGKLPEIAHQLGAQLVWLKWPAIVPVAALAACVLVVRRDRLAAAYLLLLAVVMSGLALVYLNARVYLPALLERSAERVVMAPLLLSAVALPVLLSRLLAPRDDQGSSTRARR
jgi:hypothetical protein